VIRGEYDSLPPNVTTRKEKQKSAEPITSAFVRPQQKIKSSVACAASVETVYEHLMIMMIEKVIQTVK